MVLKEFFLWLAWIFVFVKENWKWLFSHFQLETEHTLVNPPAKGNPPLFFSSNKLPSCFVYSFPKWSFCPFRGDPWQDFPSLSPYTGHLPPQLPRC